jgi:hypothetical protein
MFKTSMFDTEGLVQPVQFQSPPIKVLLLPSLVRQVRSEVKNAGL